ncbi:MAG: DMT family transporter [Pseudomonadota bacterium]
MTFISPMVLVAIGVLLGSSMDTIIKAIAVDVNVFAVTTWRYLLGAVIISTLYVGIRRALPSFEAIRFHAFRGVCQVVTAMSFFWSLTQLGLAEATVLGFTAALLIAPIAWVVLGERINKATIIAAFIGFAGAVFALSGDLEGGPEGGNRLLGAVAALVSACGYALVLVLLRLRAQKEDSLTTMFFTNVVPATYLLVIAGGMVMFGSSYMAEEMAKGFEYFLALFVVAAMGVSCWWLFTIGYSRAPAQKLAPLDYTALIWGAGFGYLFFEEKPAWQLYIGAILIIITCLFVAFERKFINRRETKLPTSDLMD